MSTAVQSIGYEAALKQRYASIREKLVPAPPRKRIVIPPPLPRFVQDETRSQRIRRVKRQRQIDPSHVEPTSYQIPIGEPVNLLEMPSWRCIVHLVAKQHYLSFRDLTGPLRSTRIRRARQQAIYLVYTHIPSASLEWVGLRFGGRHHTTVLHLIQKERKRREAVAE